MTQINIGRISVAMKLLTTLWKICLSFSFIYVVVLNNFYTKSSRIVVRNFNRRVQDALLDPPESQKISTTYIIQSQIDGCNQTILKIDGCNCTRCTRPNDSTEFHQQLRFGQCLFESFLTFIDVDSSILYCQKPCIYNLEKNAKQAP